MRMLLVLLLLLVVSAVAPAVGSAPASVAVPVGSIGDVARYRCEGDARAQGDYTLHVLGVGEARDSTGAAHETLVLRWDRPATWDAGVGWRTFHNRVEVDLASRDIILASEYYAGGKNGGYATQAPGAAFIDVLWPRALEVALQGRTLTAGDDLTAELGPLLLADLSKTLRWGWVVEPERASASVRVLEPSPDGAVPVQVEVRGELRATMPRNGSSQLHEVGRELTLWYKEDAPFPVRVAGEFEHPVEIDPNIGAREMLRCEWRLAELSRGATPVPWQPYLPPEYGQPPEPERSTGSHPEDGSGSELDYALAEALRRVEEDPTLVEYRLWRAQNPRATLIGFAYEDRRSTCAEPCQVPQHGWSLTFAEPGNRDYIVVWSTRTGGIVHNNVALYLDRPAASACAPPDALTDGPITVAEAIRAWRGTFGEPTEGLQVWWGNPGCGFEPRYAFRHLLVRTEPLNLTGQTTLESRAVYLDATTGARLAAQDYTMPNDFGNAIPVVPPAPRPSPSATPRVEPGSAGAAAGGLAVALLGILAYFWPLLRFAFTGFTRLRKDKLLDHALRQQLMVGIRAAPGITPPRLQEATRAGWSTVVYHLRVMEREGLVTSRIDGRHRRFFAVGQLPAGELGRASVLANPSTRAVHDLIRARPGIRRGEIAEAMGYTGPAAAYHILRLAREGLIRRSGGERSAGWVATAEAPVRAEGSHATHA